MTGETKKIVIISPGLGMGGVERASINLANFLSDTGHDVTFISIFRHSHFFEAGKNIKVIEPHNFNTKSLSFFKTLLFLRKQIHYSKPDTILSFTRIYSAFALLAVSFTGYKVYITERSSPLYKWPLKINLLYRIAFFIKKPAGIIAQTKIAAEYQARRIGNKVLIKVIPNPLRNVKLFPHVERKRHILAVGRFNDSSKGFDRLIEAYSISGLNDWKLIFAGDNMNDSSIKQLAVKKGIIDNVVFLGAIRDIDPVFAEAGMFVIPSRSEGFPNALCEAMAAGLPSIAFDFVAGPRDIIMNSSEGIIVKDGDITGLANAIIQLAGNQSDRIRIGNNAMIVRERFNINKVCQLYFEFITSHIRN